MSRNPLVASRCAEYLGYFVADDAVGNNMPRGTQWLVWRFESDCTLAGAREEGTAAIGEIGGGLRWGATHVFCRLAERCLPGCSFSRASLHVHSLTTLTCTGDDQQQPITPTDGLDGALGRFPESLEELVLGRGAPPHTQHPILCRRPTPLVLLSGPYALP